MAAPDSSAAAATTVALIRVEAISSEAELMGEAELEAETEVFKLLPPF